MAYQIIIKTLRGRRYAYVYRAWREGKKIKKKFIRYLGTVDRPDVQRTIREFREGKREFIKRKKKKRAPEIDVKDVRSLSRLEKNFIAIAIVVREKAKVAYLDDVVGLAKEYCEKAGVKQPAAWDGTIDYFKTLGWIEIRAGKIKFLLHMSVDFTKNVMSSDIGNI